MAIRVTVVGAGARGLDWLREIRSGPDFELAACVDVDAEALRRAASECGAAGGACYTNLGEALEKHPCDAVVVATPADLHEAACEAALARGLGVIVEKPFTLRLAAAARLVRAAAQAHAPLIVAQYYRYMRAFRTARRLVGEGALGRVGQAVCQYYRVPHGMAASLA
ncbi:MAG: Gfo/Idh/MocA family protein, partial [Pyrinomonadaceae bacterium]